MTPARIREIREACEKATPTEKWRSSVWQSNCEDAWTATGPIHEVNADGEYDDTNDPDCVPAQQAAADSAFIALARTALPDALAEVRRLKAALREACGIADEALTLFSGHIDDNDPDLIARGHRIAELRKEAES